MSEKMRNIPKLRFPEFRDAGEWEEKVLENVCEKITQGGTPDTSNPIFWNGDIEWLTPAEMNKTESRFVDSTVRKITAEGLKNCSSDLLPIDSVIISIRAPIGHLAINTSEMAINQGCKGLIPKKSTDYNFLYYLLATFKSSLIDLGAGNTFKELSGSSLKNFKITIPDIQEQQKIAYCLSSIDELITSQAEKVEALKTHKKALMQRLFPRDGESIPRLRFPEFQNAPEWEEKPLYKIANFVNKKISLSFLEAEKYISTENILQDFSGFKKTNTLPQAGSATKFEVGDILVSNIRPYLKKIWVAEFDGGASNDVIVIRVTESVKEKFLSHNLKNNAFVDYVMAGAKGVKMPRGDVALIKKYPVLMPKLEEQQKIADCLSSLDELISAQSEKVEALKEHKKGLMQQLFPSAKEEVY